jgi:hypothetical protein
VIDDEETWSTYNLLMHPWSHLVLLQF